MGLRQSFLVEELPEGPLVLELSLRGAEAVVDADGRSATLYAPGAASELRYEGLVAWDAVGSELPAWMEATPHGLRLVVDTEGVVAPVTVDPVISGSTWSAEGDQAFAHFGESVASARRSSTWARRPGSRPWRRACSRRAWSRPPGT